MSVYLAVDAGGSKTECVIADDDHVLARVTGGELNLQAVGAAEATARLRHLLEEVSGKARVPLYLVTRACMGLAGVAGEGVRTWAERTLQEVFTGELILTGVEETALEAAFGQGPGVLVFAGKDSYVVGRTSQGSRTSAGGWGPTLGDEGSGHWIGVEGVRSGLRARDRGVSSCLLREISAQWDVNSVGALIARANSCPPPDFSALAETVARCAAQGEALARTVLERAGDELAAKVSLVVANMRAAGCSPGDLERVAYTGETLSRIPPVYAAFCAALKQTQPGIVVDREPTDPLEGALARARRQ